MLKSVGSDCSSSLYPIKAHSAYLERIFETQAETLLFSNDVNLSNFYFARQGEMQLDVGRDVLRKHCALMLFHGKVEHFLYLITSTYHLLFIIEHSNRSGAMSNPIEAARHCGLTDVYLEQLLARCRLSIQLGQLQEK